MVPKPLQYQDYQQSLILVTEQFTNLFYLASIYGGARQRHSWRIMAVERASWPYHWSFFLYLETDSPYRPSSPPDYSTEFN
jgi:hypothetical protein